MAGTRIVAPAEGWNQNKTRQLALFFDQHRSTRHPEGRAWWGYTGTPADPQHARPAIGEFLPLTIDLTVDGITIHGWDAPWTPEWKYVGAALGALAGNRFRLDYARMIADYRQANVTYYTRAAREAYARNWPAPKLFGPVSFQLRAVIGNPPKSPKVPEAALAGDPWLLGATDVVNEALRAILAEERDQLAVTLVEAGLDEVAADQKVPPGQRAASRVLGSALDGTTLTEAEIVAAVRAAEMFKRKKARRARHGAPSSPPPTETAA